MKTVDGDRAVFVVEGREDARELGKSIDHGPAEHARVHGVVENLNIKLKGNNAAKARREGGAANGPVRGVGNDDDVAAHDVLVLFEERAEGLTAVFLFTLHKHDDADAGFFELVLERAQGGHVSHNAGLVVGSAAAVQAAVALGRFKRRSCPFGLIADGLHVVVGVEHDRRLTWLRGTSRENGRRAALDGLDAHLGHTGILEERGYFFGTSPHVRLVITVKSDRGNRDERREVLECLRLKGFDLLID